MIARRPKKVKNVSGVWQQGPKKTKKGSKTRINEKTIKSGEKKIILVWQNRKKRPSPLKAKLYRGGGGKQKKYSTTGKPQREAFEVGKKSNREKQQGLTVSGGEENGQRSIEPKKRAKSYRRKEVWNKTKAEVQALMPPLARCPRKVEKTGGFREDGIASILKKILSATLLPQVCPKGRFAKKKDMSLKKNPHSKETAGVIEGGPTSFFTNNLGLKKTSRKNRKRDNNN